MTAHSNCLILTVDSKEGKEIGLEDLGLFLYDLATLYDLIRLALDPAYRDFRFGKYPLFRGRRPLKPDDQPTVEHIQFKRQLRVTASLKKTSPSATMSLELYMVEIAFLFGLAPPEISPRHSREAMEQARERLVTRGAGQHLLTVRRRLHHSSLTMSAIKLCER